MRDPSKHLNNKYEKININIESFFDETLKIYDEYAILLNLLYEKKTLTQEFMNYVEKIREKIKNKSLNCLTEMIIAFKEICSTCKLKKNKFFGGLLKNSILKIFKLIKNTSLLYNLYIESDKTLCNMYEKYVNIASNFDNKYQIFWNSIEKIRANEYKNAYNEFIKNNSFIENKIFKINICGESISINEAEELPIFIP
jgi:hypothetical protein